MPKKLDKYGWPKDGSPLGFSELSDALVNAVNFAYKLERQNKRRSIPWHGPERQPQDFACGGSIKWTLSAKQLAYSEIEQDRDALREIIGVAIGLGIEQGRRIFRESHEHQILKLKLQMAALALHPDPKPGRR
jgi:hypothetical protein